MLGILSTPKSDWLATSYEPETYFSGVKSSPTNKFSEIYDINSGKEDGTTFEISIKKKYYVLSNTGAEINVMNSVELKKIGPFDKLLDSNKSKKCKWKKHGHKRKSNTEIQNKWQSIHTHL